MRALLSTVICAALGWFLAEKADIRHLERSSIYFNSVNLLLAIGLYGCAYSINLDQILKRDWSVIFRAVTIGVFFKILIISSITFIVTRCFFADRYPLDECLGLSIVVAPIVAQIDPLSVAALTKDNSLSNSVKGILSAWSSFDDPVTVIASYYIASWIVNNVTGIFEDSTFNISLITDVFEDSTFNIFSIILDFGKNFLFASIFYLWHRLLLLLWRKFDDTTSQSSINFKKIITILKILTFLIVIALATKYRLMLGVAIIGLFAFPKFDFSYKFIYISVIISFYIATVMIGFFLVDGVNIYMGILVSLSAITAQFIIAFLMTIGYEYSLEDKIRLAFAQQNGLTAIVLALFFEPLLKGTISVIVPAILLINLIYIIVNKVIIKRYLEVEV